MDFVEPPNDLNRLKNSVVNTVNVKTSDALKGFNLQIRF